MRSYKLKLLVLFIFFLSCEDQINRRVVFYIERIIADRDVVAQGDPVNISAVLIIQGAVNENNIKYNWDCTHGEFNDKTKQATIWTAPSDATGEFYIRLKISFMGNTEEGEIAIKVVKTPADNWGSLSGNILNSGRNPLQNIIISTKSGEKDTTDINGFFYIGDVPQGITGLEFSNIEFKWVSESLNDIDIAGGNHIHLGDIIIYESTPPEILKFEEIPENQAILTINHDLHALYEYFELFKCYNQSGSDATLVKIIQPGTNSLILKEEKDSAYFALKSIPLYGESSDLSQWTSIRFMEAIDPDTEMTYFEYNDFFSATLNWDPTGYEDFYRGFKIAEEKDTGLLFISPLLSVTTFSYDFKTRPGMTGNYYIIAITKSNKYNSSQPEDQRISLEVPSMVFPAGFKGKLQTFEDTTIMLIWEPVSANNNWYSGYLIKKKVKTNTTEYNWEEFARIRDSYTGSYTDLEVDSGNIYKYSIQTVAYPIGLGIPEYSEPDSIIVNAF